MGIIRTPLIWVPGACNYTLCFAPQTHDRACPATHCAANNDMMGMPKAVPLRRQTDAAGRVAMGLRTPTVTAASWTDLWSVLTLGARDPEQFSTNVFNVLLSGGPGYWVRTLTTRYTGKRQAEHICANESNCEIAFRSADPGTDHEKEVEHVITVTEDPLHLELFARHVPR